MTARASFRDSDVSRAVRGAEKAGMRVGRVEIEPGTGKIIILRDRGEPRTAANEWDDEFDD